MVERYLAALGGHHDPVSLRAAFQSEISPSQGFPGTRARPARSQAGTNRAHSLLRTHSRGNGSRAKKVSNRTLISGDSVRSSGSGKLPQQGCLWDMRRLAQVYVRRGAVPFRVQNPTGNWCSRPVAIGAVRGGDDRDRNLF